MKNQLLYCTCFIFKSKIAAIGIIILLFLTGNLSIAYAQSFDDGPIIVKDGTLNLGLTVENQAIQNNSRIILHQGLNQWKMLSNGGIVLKSNPKYGLTVINQNKTNSAQIILHEGYNLWDVLSNGAIVLRDNHAFGLTVSGQQLVANTPIILHQGYNTWRQLYKDIIPIANTENTYILNVKIKCVEENDGGGSAEEIFGSLNAEVKGAVHNLWTRKEDAAVSIDEGRTYSVPDKLTLKGLSNNDNIKLYGHLYEEDTGGDDNLGSQSTTVSVKDLMKGKTLRFTYEDTKIDVTYWLIRPMGKYITLESVKCVVPSKGTDNATEAAIDIGIFLGTLAVALPSYYVPGGIVFVGKVGGALMDEDFADDYGKKHPGQDDLYIKIGNKRAWPSDEYIGIVSQQTIYIGKTFLYNKNAFIELREYDSGSDDDYLGSWKFTDKASGTHTVIVHHKEEGSTYEITFTVQSY